MGDISAGMSRPKLNFLAQYVIDRTDFRQQAFTPSGFQDAVENDAAFLAALEQANFDPLTRDEKAFVSGWVQHADTRFGADDTALVQAITDEIGNTTPNG
jgi:hypothetical protein